MLRPSSLSPSRAAALPVLSVLQQSQRLYINGIAETVNESNFSVAMRLHNVPDPIKAVHKEYMHASFLKKLCA